MADLYIFNQDDKLLTILSEETGLVSAPFREELNQVPDTPFSFTVEADTEEAQHVKEENQVVFRDKEGDLRLYVIKELDDTDDMDGPQTTATCEPGFMELAEHIVVDRRFNNQTADIALNAGLGGTRWTGEVEVSLGTATTNFYYVTSVDAIWKILDVWGGDFKDVVEFDDKNNIVARKIKLLQRLGADNGHRWEIDHNIEEIQRTVLSYPLTALYGRGASLETEGGGHSRYIDFADVEWKVSNGDPVDKPLGQRWVGDPDALQRYGRIHKGKMLHREGIFSNQNYDTPESLLKATWEQLPLVSKPEVNYQLKVHLLEHLAGYEHEKASLGDSSIAIDRQFSRPIEIQARVIALEYDLLDIEGTATVEMGQFLNIEDDRLDRVIDDINDNRGDWEHVTENSYPDKKPGIPTNVRAVGGFKIIQLYWDYTNEIYVKNYEVYGSQVKGFVPDSQHLLWRGDVSAFAHDADTDQTWYYRVRAVNYHGTASDYSVEVTADTVRIMTPDILFGSVIADHLEENLDLANKLSDGTLEWINETPIQQIRDTEKQILDDVSGRIENVNSSIDDLVGITDNIDGKVINITEDVDEINGRLTTTIEELSNLDGVVGRHGSTLDQQYDLIQARVTDEDFNTATGELTNKIGEVDVKADGIQSTVQDTQSKVNDLTGEVEHQSTQISQANQRADGFEQSVINLESDLGTVLGEMTLIDQKADNITLSVSEISGDIENLQSNPLSYINLSQEGVKIHARYIDLEGDVYMLNGRTHISEAVIGTAAIANAAIDKFHLKNGIIENVHIADATIENSKIKSLDADKINAASLSAVSANLGSVTGGSITQESSGYKTVMAKGSIETYTNGRLTSILSGSGHDFYRSGRIGKIGASNWVSDPSYRGLTFNMTNEASYMAWTHDDDGDGVFTTKLAWHKDSSIDNKGFTFWDHINLPTDYNLYVRTLSTRNYNGGNRHVQLQNFTWDGVDGVAIRRSTSGGFLFVSDSTTAILNSGNAYLEVGEDGTGNYVTSIDVYNRTYTSTSQMMRVTHNGVFGRSTSSRRFKLCEEPVALDYAEKILEIDAKSWHDKRASEDYAHTLTTGEETENQRVERVGGVIAEDVHGVGLTRYVSYDKEGKPEGLHDSLWTLLIPVTKNHDSRLTDLEAENKMLKERVKQLEESA